MVIIKDFDKAVSYPVTLQEGKFCLKMKNPKTLSPTSFGQPVIIPLYGAEITVFVQRIFALTPRRLVKRKMLSIICGPGSSL